MKKQSHKVFIKNRIKALFGKEKLLEEKTLDEFVEDIADHQQTLQERIKELNCLYEASRLMEEKEITTDQFMQSLSNIIQQAWQFPEITCVKIKIDGNEYLTANFSDTPWKLASPVTMEGKDTGLLQVCYLEEKPASDEGPFLKEERNLLETIARNLSRYLQNKKSEELLKKSRQRLLDAQRIAKMGDFTWNVQTGGVQWSEAMYELLGYDKDEKINFEKVNVDIHHPDDLERVIDWLNRCIKTGEEYHEPQEYRVVRKDGKVLEVQTHIRLKYVEGKATELLGTVQDITQRKLDEKALWESRENFRVTLHSIGDAVIATDTNGRITTMNPVAEKLTAWEFEAAKGKNIQEVFKIHHAKTGNLAENPVEKVLKSGHIVGLANHTKLLAKDGKEYQIADSAAPIVDKNGDTIGVVLVFRDVTDEYRMQQEIADKQLKLNDLFNSIRDAILVTDTNRKIIQCNPAFTDLFGFTEKELLVKETSFIYKDLQEFESMGQKLKENMDNPNFLQTIHYRKKNDEVFPGETNVFYLRDANGNIQGFIGMIRDITDRKKAEEELAQSYELMRYIIENTNSAVAVHDRDLRYIYVSQRYLNDYKISGQDVIEKHHYEVFPDLPEKWREVHRRALRGEVLSADRDPYHRADGTVDWTRWECRPWYENEDTIGGIIVYTEVITEQVESEMKLKEYNKKLEQAEESARLGSWEVDLQTGKTWWSKQMFKLLGFEQSNSAPGFDEYLEHIHPDDKEKVSLALDNLKKGVITPSMEYRGNPDFTGQRYLLSRAEGVKDQTGKPIKITGTVLDITDQKLIENEINKLKENLEDQVKEKTIQLQDRIDELERYRDATVEREFRMKELREEIERLKREKND